MTLPQLLAVMGFTGTRFPPGSDTRAAVLSCRIPCFTSNMPYYMHVLEVANLRTPCTGASTLSLFLSTADRILHWPLPPFAAHLHLAPKCLYSSARRVVCDTILFRYRLNVNHVCSGKPFTARPRHCLDRVLAVRLFYDAVSLFGDSLLLKRSTLRFISHPPTPPV